MSINPFEERIEQLLTNQETELIVERDEFMQFREVWVAHPQRKEIVGEAGLNGRITYRYVKSVEKEADIDGK